MNRRRYRISAPLGTASNRPGHDAGCGADGQQGVAAIKILDDRWTVVTQDGKLSAHYENTILVTDDGPEILTTIGDI